MKRGIGCPQLTVEGPISYSILMVLRGIKWRPNWGLGLGTPG